MWLLGGKWESSHQFGIEYLQGSPNHLGSSGCLSEVVLEEWVPYTGKSGCLMVVGVMNLNVVVERRSGSPPLLVYVSIHGT